MSMRAYGFDDYGIKIPTELIIFVANKILDERRQRNGDNEKYNPIDPNKTDALYDALDIVADIAQYVGDFEGSICTLGNMGQDYMEIEDEFDYYFPIPRYPSLFSIAYNNMEELIEDMITRYGVYLPDDFDYEGNLVHIVGTYFG